MHDCKKICALLWKQYEIAVKEVFDTQVRNYCDLLFWEEIYWVRSGPLSTQNRALFG